MNRKGHKGYNKGYRGYNKRVFSGRRPSRRRSSRRVFSRRVLSRRVFSRRRYTVIFSPGRWVLFFLNRPRSIGAETAFYCDRWYASGTYQTYVLHSASLRLENVSDIALYPPIAPSSLSSCRPWIRVRGLLAWVLACTSLT